VTSKIGGILLGVTALTLVAACGQKPDEGPSTSPGDAITTTEAGAATAETSSEGTETTTSAPAAAVSQWTMPNMVGKNLQAAQDKMQSVSGNPIFITTSHDATGAGRHQVLDGNWKVCSQNVAPGKTVDENSQIDFGAVKNEESCP
jgi:PASTA domain-containing protein